MSEHEDWSAEYLKTLGLKDWKEYYDFVGNKPEVWIGKAEELIAAATVLAEKCVFLRFVDAPDLTREMMEGSDLLHPLLLLRAFAVECFLKSIWLAKGNTLVVEGRFQRIPVLPDQHDLVALATACALPADGRQMAVLFFLSLYGQGGRYPVLTRWDKAVTAPRGKPLLMWNTPLESGFAALLKNLRSVVKNV